MTHHCREGGDINYPSRGLIASGRGPPYCTTGSDGDFYYDTINNLFYGPKKNGEWTMSPFSLKGAQGPVGESGANGNTGISGSQIYIGHEYPFEEDIGSFGDYYFQLNEDNELMFFYGPKNTEGWGYGMPFGVQNNSSTMTMTMGNSNKMTIESSGYVVDGNLEAKALFTPVAAYMAPIASSANGDILLVLSYYIDPSTDSHRFGNLYVSNYWGVFSISDIDLNGIYYDFKCSMSPDGKYIMLVVTQPGDLHDSYAVYISKTSGIIFDKYSIHSESSVNIINASIIMLENDVPVYTYMINNYELDGNHPIVYRASAFNNSPGPTWIPTVSDTNFGVQIIVDYKTSTNNRVGYALSFTVDSGLTTYYLYRNYPIFNSWTPYQVNNTDDRHIMMVTSADGINVVVLMEHMIYLSDTEGTSFDVVDISSFPNAEIFKYITLSSNGQTVYVSYLTHDVEYVIYYSTDFGGEWNPYYVATTMNTAFIVSGNTNKMIVYDGILYTTPLPGPHMIHPVDISDKYSLTEWYDIVMSQDGLYRAAVTQYGGIYVSRDFGVTWTLEKTIAVDMELFRSEYLIVTLDMDNTGRYLICCYGDTIYLNNNYGYREYWTSIPMTSYPNIRIYDVAIRGDYNSSTTNNVAALIAKTNDDRYHIFTLSDNNFIDRLDVEYVLNGVSINDDGLCITASVHSITTRKYGAVYVSSNAGANFDLVSPIYYQGQPLNSGNSMFSYNQVSMSADGKYQLIGGSNLMLSSDYGATMIFVSGFNTYSGSSITGIKVSSTGQYQFISITAYTKVDGQEQMGNLEIYMSSDYGKKWFRIFIIYPDIISPIASVSSFAFSSDLERFAFVSNKMLNIYQSIVAETRNSVVPEIGSVYNIGNQSRIYKATHISNPHFTNSIVYMSDARHKEDIRDLTLGSDFIKSIRPVAYRHIDNSDKIHFGVIAQELERAIIKSKRDVSETGLIEKNGDRLGVSYTELIAPLIKSTHEIMDTLEIEKIEIDEVRHMLEKLEHE